MIFARIGLEPGPALSSQCQDEGGFDPGQVTVQRHIAAVALADDWLALSPCDGAADPRAERKDLDGLKGPPTRFAVLAT